MKLNRQGVENALRSGRITLGQLRALAAKESGTEAMRALEAISTVGGASPTAPLGESLAEAQQLAESLLRDHFVEGVRARSPADPAQRPAATFSTVPPTLWEQVTEKVVADPAASRVEVGAQRIEAGAAHLVRSQNPEIRKRAVKVAESAQSRRLEQLVANRTVEVVDVAGKPILVHGATAREAAAIQREFERLTEDGFGRGVPHGHLSPPEIFVLDDAEYQRMVGDLANDYDARYVTYTEYRRCVVRRSTVTRSIEDGTSLRQAMLPTVLPIRPYAASPLGNERFQGTIIRGSTLTPELLRALSDADVMVAVLSLRLEDPGGAAERALIDRENHNRAAQGKAPLTFTHVPIPDHTVPGEPALRALVTALTDPANRPLYLHCFGGLGRTGVATAMAEIVNGEEPEVAAQRFSDFIEAIGVTTEANPKQRDFIVEFGHRWKAGDFDDAIHPRSPPR